MRDNNLDGLNQSSHHTHDETAEEMALKLIKALKVTVDLYKVSMETLSRVINIELEKLIDRKKVVEWEIIAIHDVRVPLMTKRFFMYDVAVMTARGDFDREVRQEQLKLEEENDPGQYRFYISPVMSDVERSTGYAILKQRVGVVSK